MTHDDLELRLSRNLRDKAPEPAWDFRDRVLAAVANVPQKRTGLVGWLPSPRGVQQGFSRRSLALLIAAALLGGLLAGAIAVGTGLVKLPSLLPLPSPEAEESAQAIPSSSAEPSVGQPLGLVVYNVIELIQPLPENCTPSNHPWCHVQRIWIANGDGSGAHELLPDVAGDQNALGWTPDGSRILYQDSTCELRFADAEGSVLETLPLDILYPTRTAESPCDYVDLSAGYSFSPDGTRLAYVVGEGEIGGSQVTTIVIYDLEARVATRLESTSATDTGTCVTASEGLNLSPMWSPDGTRLVVTRDNIGPIDANHACQSIIFTVNADGTDYRVLVPSEAGSEPLDASWSPDGSRIVFRVGNYANGGVGDTCDIATVRPDGSDLHRLTSDGISCGGGWTPDGRILFVKWLDPEGSTRDVWIMDADGGNPVKLQGDSLADFIVPECVDCPYVFPDNTPTGLRQPLP